MIDDLTALRLQFDWGVDEALGDRPIDRFAPAPRPAAPPPVERTAPPVAASARSAVQARTLDELHAEIDAFTACPLRATATHTVRPSGSPTAPILVMGDAPGSDDDRSGQAFSGAAGATLDRVFGSIGLDRSGMLLTTLVPWRPPGNRPASESEMQACLPFVHRLIGIVRPRIVLLLGAGPVMALAGQTGTIRQLRGKWLDLQITSEQLMLQGLPVLPLAQWLRDGTTKQQLWSDLMVLHQAITTT
jgi:DNA polymerase